jgi:hypothetical protein
MQNNNNNIPQRRTGRRAANMNDDNFGTYVSSSSEAHDSQIVNCSATIDNEQQWAQQDYQNGEQHGYGNGNDTSAMFSQIENMYRQLNNSQSSSNGGNASAVMPPQARGSSTSRRRGGNTNNSGSGGNTSSNYNTSSSNNSHHASMFIDEAMLRQTAPSNIVGGNTNVNNQQNNGQQQVSNNSNQQNQGGNNNNNNNGQQDKQNWIIGLLMQQLTAEQKQNVVMSFLTNSNKGNNNNGGNDMMTAMMSQMGNQNSPMNNSNDGYSFDENSTSFSSSPRGSDVNGVMKGYNNKNSHNKSVYYGGNDNMNQMVNSQYNQYDNSNMNMMNQHNAQNNMMKMQSQQQMINQMLKIQSQRATGSTCAPSSTSGGSRMYNSGKNSNWSSPSNYSSHFENDPKKSYYDPSFYNSGKKSSSNKSSGKSSSNGSNMSKGSSNKSIKGHNSNAHQLDNATANTRYNEYQKFMEQMPYYLQKRSNGGHSSKADNGDHMGSNLCVMCNTNEVKVGQNVRDHMQPQMHMCETCEEVQLKKIITAFFDKYYVEEYAKICASDDEILSKIQKDGLEKVASELSAEKMAEINAAVLEKLYEGVDKKSDDLDVVKQVERVVTEAEEEGPVTYVDNIFEDEENDKNDTKNHIEWRIRTTPLCRREQKELLRVILNEALVNGGIMESLGDLKLNEMECKYNHVNREIIKPEEESTEEKEHFKYVKMRTVWAYPTEDADMMITKVVFNQSVDQGTSVRVVFNNSGLEIYEKLVVALENSVIEGKKDFYKLKYQIPVHLKVPVAVWEFLMQRLKNGIKRGEFVRRALDFHETAWNIGGKKSANKEVTEFVNRFLNDADRKELTLWGEEVSFKCCRNLCWRILQKGGLAESTEAHDINNDDPNALLDIYLSGSWKRLEKIRFVVPTEKFAAAKAELDNNVDNIINDLSTAH